MIVVGIISYFKNITKVKIKCFQGFTYVRAAN